MKPPGYVHEVELEVEPHELMSHDLPFNQQSKLVQKALRGARYEAGRKTPEGERYTPDSTGSEWISAISGTHFKYNLPTYNPMLANRQDRAVNKSVAQFVRDALLERGVKGTRYLDKLSRDGDGSSENYIALTPDVIRVMRRYGLPITAGGIATLSAALNKQQVDA